MPYKDPAKRAEIKRRWHEKHPTWRNDWKRDHPEYPRIRLLRKYGLTLEDYEALRQNQNGCCAICRKADDKLVVDHCHGTGKFRALLCNNCNTALGMVADNPETARALATYLEAHPSRQLQISI